MPAIPDSHGDDLHDVMTGVTDVLAKHSDWPTLNRTDPQRRVAASTLLTAARTLYGVTHKTMRSTTHKGDSSNAVSAILGARGLTAPKMIWAQLQVANNLTLQLANRYALAAARLQILEDGGESDIGSNQDSETENDQNNHLDANGDSEDEPMISLASFSNKRGLVSQNDDIEDDIHSKGNDNSDSDEEGDEEEEELQGSEVSNDDMELPPDLLDDDEDEESHLRDRKSTQLDTENSTDINIPKFPGAQPRRTERTELDDEFFSLDALERFADFGEKRDMLKAEILNKREERRRNKSQTDEVESESEDDESANPLLSKEFDFDLDNVPTADDDGDYGNIMYEDFFGPKKINNSSMEKATFKGRPSKRLQDIEDENKERLMGESDEEDTDDNVPRKESKVRFADDEDEEEEEGEGELEDDEQSEEEMASRHKDLFADDDDENDGNDSDGSQKEEMSRFELQQKRLQEEIEELEEEAVGEKPWQMKGEAKSAMRPANSLLEEDFITDVAAKPVPVVTEETTAELEEMIMQRIRDTTFDDVVRRAPPRNVGEYDPNRRIEIDDSKSKKSLSEVYEDDFKRAKDPKMATEKDEKLKAQHDEIMQLYKTLCSTLDDLCH